VAEYGEALSERELEVLRLVATGASNREIAYRLHISSNTVKVHLRNIFAKIGAESRTAATMIAVQEGWVEVPATPSAALPPTVQEEVPVPVPPAPLPWSRRITLLVAALLAVVTTALAWPRGVGRGAGREGLLPARGGSEVSGGISVGGETLWEERAQMPTRRAGLALAAWERRLYAIGGQGPEGVTAVVEVYDPQNDTWTRAADKPTPVAYVSAAVVDGGIMVPGGCTSDGGATAVVEVYDPQSDHWSDVTPLPVPLCAYSLVVYDGRVYLFGGSDGEETLGVTLVYDPASGRWAERAPLPRARTVAAAAALGERIYVVGGYRDGRALSDCDVYDPAADHWGQCAPLTVGRSGLGLVALGGQLYAIGGGEYLGFNERYDPPTDHWTAVHSPLTGVWQSPGVAMLDLIIYAVGGWTNDYVGLNLAFEPLPLRTFLPVTEQ